MGDSIACYLLPNLLPDSAFLLEVIHFGHDYYFHIPKTMPPTLMIDLLVGHGFLRESQARTVDLEMLFKHYWTSSSDSPKLIGGPQPSILQIPTASERMMIQNSSQELQKEKQEMLAETHHIAKGMKLKIAYDLIWVA